MIAMLDTSEALDVCEREMECACEQLLTPATCRLRQRAEAHFAIDNGSFSQFVRKEFLSLLKREQPCVELCRFLVVPDVVANARRTLEVFRYWQFRLTGWPLALAAQDGLEDLDIPWDDLAAIFIGGSTKWKMSECAADVIKAAKAMDVWVHAGRVNTPGRFEYFEALGADSIDGTGLAQFTHARAAIANRSISLFPPTSERTIEEVYGTIEIA
jgi:hypothetical protein